MSLLSLAEAALSSALPEGSGGALGSLLGGLSFTQDTRILSIQTALPGAFVAERFSGRECVNELYTFDVDVLSVSADLDVRPLLGQPASLGLMLPDGSSRSWTGYVTQACTLGADGGFARYRLRLQPWVAYLESHRDCRIFQDQTVQGVLSQVFADYPQAAYQWNVTQRLRTRPICTQFCESDLAFMQRLLADEGLSYRFEHAQGGGSGGAPQAQHTLVIFDMNAPVPPQDETSIRFHRAGVTEDSDAIVSLRESRRAVPNAVTVAAWDSTTLVAIAGQAQADNSGLSQAEVYSGHRSGLYPDADYANQIAALRLAGLQLPGHLFSGTSSVRSLDAGKSFTLTEHFANNGDYIPLVVEHSGANNLGNEVKTVLGMHDLESGSYRNRFTAIPAATPIVPAYRDKPTATGGQLAWVVGVAGEVLTSNRDHMVRIQFPWQRGVQPLAGGLSDTGSTAYPQGHAPGDETSAAWVRVAEYTAGANHGGSFTPRIGTEVWVSFLHNDIDQPVVTGSLYTGQDPPPFAAGVDSGANHPGTLSGIHTQTLDGGDTSQWVHDDSPGQLRNRLATSHLQSELNLGYLIDQPGASRGAFRGEGFELTTQGWSTVRTAQGLLISTSIRQGGVSTQHDASEAIGQLQAAQTTAKALSDAAAQQQALPLKANQQQQDFIKAIDPQQDGSYTAPTVGGQPTTKPTDDAGSGGDPVENFSIPAILLETPSSLLAATPNSYAAFASQALHLTVQQDAHLASNGTVSTVSAQASSLFSYDGGLLAVAANGPLSIQAHSDALQILADQSVTVTSTADAINILANTKIVLQAGQASVTLDGQNITFACPGNFTVKSGTHQFVGAQSDAAQLPALPAGQLGQKPNELELFYQYDDLSPIASAPYKVTFSDGTVRSGTVDGKGYALLQGVPNLPYKVEFGEDPAEWVPPPLEKAPPQDYDKPDVKARAQAQIDKRRTELAADDGTG